MQPETTGSQFKKITVAHVESLRAMIGKPIRSDRPHITELSADAIRHYALGIGDRNPLWLRPRIRGDGDLGHRAPPTILFAMDKVFSGYVAGLPGIHAMYAGASFEFARPLHVGDRLSATARLKELRERPSRFAGRSFQQSYAVDFHDADGTLVCNAESYCFRTERDTARDRGKYTPKEIRWTPDEIDEIAARYRVEEGRRRGASTLFVDDVAVGDALPDITKGPYTATTAIAYLLGWGGLYVRAHGDAFDMFERHPALGIPNEHGVPEPPERVHWDADLARRVGVPAPYDYGPERVSWMAHPVTDWIGDDGFLKKLSVQVRRHNVLGELVTCQGIVESVDADTGIVRVSLSAHNQDGEESARGTAEVVLPRRGA